MTSSLQSQIIKQLKIASIQYQHEQFLKIRHFSDEGERFFNTVVPNYQRKLDYFFGIKKNHNTIKQRIDRFDLKIEPKESITIRKFENEEDIRKIARKASVYFQQGLEMLETSFSMPENTCPLVEYYALLQCAKGFIILDLDVTEELFFTQHGLKPVKISDEEQSSKYLSAQVMPLGVFSALSIRTAFFEDKRLERNDPEHYENAMEDYFDESFLPSIENIVIYDNDNPYSQLMNNSLTTFIGSWMLSTLVRYAPMEWQEILAGQENDLIKHIRDFRNERLIRVFDSFLPDHMR